MNKSLEALLRGYVCFDVNGKRYYNYIKANERAEIFIKIDHDMTFTGYNIFKGWKTFCTHISSNKTHHISQECFRNLLNYHVSGRI